MNEYDLVVIGAGPAGLLAAGMAAQEGLKVLLLEKMEKPARKLRITGKGRCNITNTKSIDEFLDKVHPNPRFFKPAFLNFTNLQTIDFLNKIGLPTVAERGDRVFPASQKAWDVAEALINWAKQQGVEIVCHSKVNKLLYAGNKAHVAECETKQGKQLIKAKAFAVTTGGLSYPATGSTGDGYRFAQQANIQVTPTRPSLVGIELEKPDQSLNKLEMKNVNLSLFIEKNLVQEEFGEMNFTPYGIDGPIVLKISRKVVDALLKKQQVTVSIDFKPAITHQQLHNRINRELEQNNAIDTVSLLRKLLPSALAGHYCNLLKLAPHKAFAQLKEGTVNELVNKLKNYQLKVTGYRPFTEAIITAGGIDLKEIDSKTMRAKKIENLFFAGEVLDLDANTGGYNLQIAFSTGYLAGKKAAEYVNNKG